MTFFWPSSVWCWVNLSLNVIWHALCFWHFFFSGLVAQNKIFDWPLRHSWGYHSDRNKWYLNCCINLLFSLHIELKSNLITGCATRPPLMFCCIIFELIIWNPTQLVNSPVFFFRCPLCSRWIGYCISALLVCVCECKAAVLYHINLNTQLVCT